MEWIHDADKTGEDEDSWMSVIENDKSKAKGRRKTEETLVSGFWGQYRNCVT
jgi:hypothetical protein